MIRLVRTEPPVEMTAEWVEKQTAKFISNQELRVWDFSFLKKALLEMSAYKCAYSEIQLHEEGKLMEVEHFLPKSIYPNQVLDWLNLLPSSRHCNNAKREKDPNKYPLVNPITDNPKEHFYMLDYILFGRTQKGKNSVIVLKLNDEQQLISPRREIGIAVRTELHKQYQQVIKLADDGLTPDEEIRITASLENLMNLGKATKPYSATVATVLLDDPHFKRIKTFFVGNALWSDELQLLEQELANLRLDTAP
ncbi:hypothetical protein [Larkinella sp. C7]|uniref:hypothetical protein n=1 Tax=Larkinella sp. C7 TaxID=2576607 RepID=UPI0011111F7E|nr:hypothetical protein [Larkinella sp. C7]